MKVGILNTAQLPPELEATVGSYPQMIRNALGTDYAYREFNVTQGELPTPYAT